ncbi:hypothetical protein N7470_003266 [Penicillium chermesinum]|nr:hypothetical protein N7470_003266 [Penicillium chermesinum]
MHIQSIVVALVAPILASSYRFNPLEHSSGIAPYFTPHDPPLEASPPQGCNVTRAAYLVRHAAIYANDFDYETYIEPFLEKLTRVGLQEARSLGVTLNKRYAHLKKPTKLWSSTAERTVKSAQGFIEGFTNNRTKLLNLTQVAESKKAGADSLTPYKACSAHSSSYGSDQSENFMKVYTKPIIARLNAEARSFNFTEDDVTGMFELCGYETVIRGSSPFCSLDLFTPDEWLGFEYTNDLQYFYNTGYGRDLSPSLGFPWVNASVAALDEESRSQELFVSFTHRELPPTVITALGLYNNSAYTGANNVNQTMPQNRINYNRAWKTSQILPFLENIAIEKMSCQSYGYDEGSYYRLLNNAGPLAPGGLSGWTGRKLLSEQFHDFIRQRRELFGDFNKACGDKHLPASLSIYQP